MSLGKVLRLALHLEIGDYFGNNFACCWAYIFRSGNYKLFGH